MFKASHLGFLLLFLFLDSEVSANNLRAFIESNSIDEAKVHLQRFPESANEDDMFGMKPMHLVARGGTPEMCLLLMHHGAVVDSKTHEFLEYNDEYSHDILDCLSGKTKYEYTKEKAREKTPNIENLIKNLNSGVRGERYSADSLICGNPLDWKKVCSHETTDAFPCRCLDMSILYGNNQEFEREVSRASINQRNFLRETSLIVAIRNGNFTSAKSLLQHGADPNFKTPSGKTAAHFAAEHGDDKSILLLWLNNAFLNISDDYGNFPQIYARNSEHSWTEQLIKVLRDPIFSKLANWTKVLDGLTTRK